MRLNRELTCLHTPFGVVSLSCGDLGPISEVGDGGS